MAAETTFISIISLGLKVCAAFVYTVTSMVRISPVTLLLCDTNECVLPIPVASSNMTCCKSELIPASVVTIPTLLESITFMYTSGGSGRLNPAATRFIASV